MGKTDAQLFQRESVDVVVATGCAAHESYCRIRQQRSVHPGNRTHQQ
jgi:hypothetical protein